MAIGASLYLYHLGAQPFWRDEAMDLAVAQANRHDFIQMVVGYQANKGLYCLFLRFWSVLGDSDFMTRLPSAVFAVAALPVLYGLGAKLFDRRVGLVAALLLSVHLFFVEYAQEARAYTLTVLLTLVSWSCMISSFRFPSLANRLGYVIAASLAVYAHAFAILTLPAQWVAAALLLGPDPAARRRFVVDSCAIGLLVLPILFTIENRDVGQHDWIARAFGRPSLAMLQELAARFAGGFRARKVTRLGLMALYGGGVLIAGTAFIRTRKRGDARARSYAVVAAASIIPIALILSLSMVKPVFVPRYVLICLPFVVLLAASGWCQIRDARLFVLTVSLLTVLSISADWTYYSHPYKPAWNEVIPYLTDSVKSGDKLILLPSPCRYEFDRNLKRFGDPSRSPTILYPRWDSQYRLQGMYHGAAAMHEPNPILTRILSLDYTRLWVIGCDLQPADLDGMLAGLNPSYHRLVHRNLRRLSISLFSTNLAARSNAGGSD